MAPNTTLTTSVTKSTRKSSVVSETFPRKEKVKEILCDNYFYDVTDWVSRHPGGKIIEYYTESGEDATVAIQQFHHRSIKKIDCLLKSFKKRPANESQIGLDPETLTRHRALTIDFVQLHNDLVSEGYFKPSPSHICYRLLELVLYATIGCYLFSIDSLLLNAIGLILFALFKGRCGWVQHESGHHSLTGNSKVDRLITKIVMGVGDGLSASYWFSQHHRHHAMPQRLQRDVDLETLPLIAFNARLVKDSKQGKSFFIRHQAALYLGVDTFLVALMWKLYLHPRYVIYKKKYFEFFLMLLSNGFIYFIGFWPYLTAIWLATVYMLGNFTLSHTHLPVTTKALHWVEYGLLHTMNIESSWWIDWWMGYLNYQIEHHLFPSIPQFRLHGVQDRVRALAVKHGIPYQCVSYGQAVRKTYENLIEVSQQLQLD